MESRQLLLSALFALGTSSVCSAAPYPNDAPWPVFRGDSKNTGNASIQANYNGQSPWYFQTSKGIFSTPVIDANETIYVGSADHRFYALNSDGSVKWSYKTGEIIDSAAALTLRDDEHFITIPSGDGHLYHMTLDESQGSPADRIRWSFNANLHRHEKDIGYDWFEGNVVAGPDGTIYAGNTNWNYYKLNPDSGELLWRFPTNNMNWSAGAFDDEGNVFWTSLDLNIRKVDTDAEKTLWNKLTLGFVTASVALGSDDTAYVGSFDNGFYALNTKTGYSKWRFQTTDHIYGSAALSEDSQGNTIAVYFTSADGFLYKVNTAGELQWKYDVGDVIRSSPVVSLAPNGENQDIIYFGSANGRIYAINGSDGTLRWAFDTNQDNPELTDRNDLNGSPALGKNGLYIAGEHGYIWHVPYDYPLHNPQDPRAITSLPARQDSANMHFASAGGSTIAKDILPTISGSSVINTRLIVQRDGERIDAGIHTSPSKGISAETITNITPFVPFNIEPSADAHYLHIVPQDFLEPDTTYHLDFSGEYMWDGFRFGNIEIGAKYYDNFSDSITLQTAPAYNNRLPLFVQQDSVTAFELRRLAVPYPAMMTSLNQIGFDSYHWIVGVVDISEPDTDNRGNLIIWAIGAYYNEAGDLVPLKGSEFMFPMTGKYRNDSFMLEGKQIEFEVSGIRVPFNTFQMRGQLMDDLSVLPGATVYAEVSPFNDPVYGPLLAAGGLLNANTKVVASGSFLSSAYQSDGTANKRPENLTVENIIYEKPAINKSGTITVRFNQNSDYLAQDHLTSVLIVDDATGEPVWINYRTLTSELVDDNGALQAITLELPAATPIPEKPRAIVMADVFPMYQETLQPATWWERLMSRLLKWFYSILP
ncbi:MAG: PQQ-binding-like beta-propeller repeat protein [Pseudomonadales bacterium]|nr:PQQ-binding-like beta-propeller repeat protein [Pseudomonadales bacterium]